MARLTALWGRLKESLWLVPSIIVVGAILLGIGLVEASTLVDGKALARWPRIFGAGPEGSRSMLSAIASSMITVAGVTFSITIVAVTQASTQYSPRILRNFMQDRANQAVLGTFVGIFAYCLVVLRTIREGEEAEFVPSLAVLVGVLLALVGVTVLIFFVHHIATTLQASEIVSRIARDTLKVVKRMFPDPLDHASGDLDSAGLEGAVPLDGWHPVPAPRTGYIQHYNRSRLLEIAVDNDLLFRVEHPAGDFVVEGQPLAWFAGHPDAGEGRSTMMPKPDEVARPAARTVFVGANRSLEHDPGFGFRQLVDVALKALSPGINDSTTALTCVDYLGALLIQLVNRRNGLDQRGADGKLRVITAEPGFEELLERAVEEIRQHAGGNIAVLERLLTMLDDVNRATGHSSRRRAVLRQLELVRATAKATVPQGHDLARVEALAQRLLTATQERHATR